MPFKAGRKRVIPTSLFLLAAVACLFGPLLSAPAKAQQVLARRNALTAYLLECGPQVTIEIHAPDGRLFANELGDFGKMTGAMKYIVPQACPKVEKVTLTGKVNGELWFAGAIKPSDKWRMVSLYAPPN